GRQRGDFLTLDELLHPPVGIVALVEIRQRLAHALEVVEGAVLASLTDLLLEPRLPAAAGWLPLRHRGPSVLPLERAATAQPQWYAAASPTEGTLSNLAVVVDPDARGRLVLKPVPEPVPDRSEAIVRVRAISLNRGEVRRSRPAAAGSRPGWAPGGVGDFAGQLARQAGAHVTGLVRRADQVPSVRQLGAHEVIVGDEVPKEPKYDLIVESVGGRTLGTALAALQRAGVCVTLGVSASAEVTFDAREFFVAGRSTLYGFYVFTELGNESASVGLGRLADLVAAGQLSPHISLERPWKEIAQVAQDLMARRYPGKAVL